MSQTSFIPSFKLMLEKLGERMSERRLLRAVGRLEESTSDSERDDAFRRLTDLLSRDPRALTAYIGHRELEAQLFALKDDPAFLATAFPE